MMTRSLIFIVALILCGAVQAEEQHYLFSYFTNNGEDGLHLAHSTDGYNWQNIADGKSLLAPTAGVDRLLRDPSIVQGPDGTFHMVWTVSWKERSIGYSSSKDLINWAPQQTLPVMEHEPTAENCWAPEIFYDDATSKFYVLWATTIPGRFPETEGKKSDQQAPADHNHRIYYFTTPDFKQISETKLFYDGGFNVIDTALLKAGERYALFLKDETNIPGAAEKNIRVAFGPSATGPFTAVSERITGDYWAEGPSPLQVGDRVLVYFDKYRDRKYGVVSSRDLEHWTDESDKLHLPRSVKHGTAFSVPTDVAERLLKLSAATR